MKRTFIDRTEDGFLKQLDNFLSKIGNYASVLELSASKIAALRSDQTFLKFIVALALSYKTTSAGLTKYKEALRLGGDVLGALPQLPALPAALPTATSAGVEGRFRELVQDIARHGATTDAILKDLGIAATDAVVDNSVAKPEFYLEYTSGGYPLIVWKKSRFEGVEIWKSTDGLNFSKLDKDFKPDFIDKSDLPATGKAEKWHYKLIYLVNDEHVGQFSDAQNIAVSG
jgi:hypothetical protein